MTTQLSPLAQQLKDRNKKKYEFDMINCTSYHSQVSGKFKMKVLSAAELNTAHVEASLYLKNKYKDMSAVSPEVIEHARIAYIIEKSCFTIKTLPDGTITDRIQLFPSGDWILNELSPMELAAFLNLYSACVSKDGPIDVDLSEQRLEHLADKLALHSNSDSPNIALALLDSEIVSEIAIRFAVTISKLREEIEQLKIKLEKNDSSQNQ